MIGGLGFQFGKSAGRAEKANEHAAMIEVCLKKELDSHGLAECDDPNYQVRELPSGIKLVMYFGELQDDLRYVSSYALFAPKNYEFMVEKMFVWDDDPLKGSLVDCGLMTGTLQRDGYKLIIEEVTGRVEPDHELYDPTQAPETLYGGALGQHTR